MPRFFNAHGIIATTEAVRILENTSDLVWRISLITLYNQNTTISEFILRLVSEEERTRRDQVRRRFDDAIPITEPWIYGVLGPPLVLMPRQRYEIVLDANPTKPIEYVLDCSEGP